MKLGCWLPLGSWVRHVHVGAYSQLCTTGLSGHGHMHASPTLYHGKRSSQPAPYLTHLLDMLRLALHKAGSDVRHRCHLLHARPCPGEARGMGVLNSMISTAQQHASRQRCTLPINQRLWQ